SFQLPAGMAWRRSDNQPQEQEAGSWELEADNGHITRTVTDTRRSKRVRSAHHNADTAADPGPWQAAVARSAAAWPRGNQGTGLQRAHRLAEKAIRGDA